MTIEEAIAAVVQQRAGQPAKPTTVREMSADERREYNRRQRAEHRQRLRETEASGAVPMTETALREVLADAALILLGIGGDRGTEISALMHRAWPGKAGWILKAQVDATSGKLRPKMLTRQRLRPLSAVEEPASADV